MLIASENYEQYKIATFNNLKRRTSNLQQNSKNFK